MVLFIMNKLKPYLILYGVLGLALVAIAQTKSASSSGLSAQVTNNQSTGSEIQGPQPAAGPAINLHSQAAAKLVSVQKSRSSTLVSKPDTSTQIKSRPKVSDLPEVSKPVPSPILAPDPTLEPNPSATPKPAVLELAPVLEPVDDEQIDQPKKKSNPPTDKNQVNPDELNISVNVTVNKAELQRISEKAMKELADQLKDSKNIRDMLKKND